MTLEINLTSTVNAFSPVRTFLTRTRYSVENQNDIFGAYLKFLQDHLDTIESTVADGDLINRIKIATTIDEQSFNELRYLLCMSGLDIIAAVVADNEVNADAIPDGKIEYMIIENNNSLTPYSNFATKVVNDADGSLSTVYNAINELYAPFQSQFVDESRNPFKVSLDALNESELIAGHVPTSLTERLNTLMEFLGFKTYVFVQ